MRRLARFTLSALLCSLFFLTLSLTSSVQAAGITVNNNADDTLINLAGNGFCDLREAIEAANTDTAVDACASGSGKDTITFDAGLSGQTIYLGSALDLTSDMTIDGSALASQVTISGDSDNDGTGNVQIFLVTGGATVTLDSLKITKGSALTGGGIYNLGLLTITNSTLSGNTATTTGAGGGIYNLGLLTVTNSTFSGNSAALDGGGIYNDSNRLAVTNSTFSGNSAALDGSGSGGGIYTFNGTLTVTNSTFSGNSAVTSGGGIYNHGGTLNYANTIIANSTSGGDCAGSGSIGTNINNLVEDGTCSPSLSVDPLLDSLKDNGGPAQTMALTLASPAVNAGDDATCAAAPVNNLDQRGVTRPIGAHCDIGAYEGALDVTAPTVDSFTASASSTSLTVPITAFTASDNVGVAGYIVTESATPPSASAAGWAASAPSTYTVAGGGSYTLYPWAKDAGNNISTVYGSPASVIVCGSLSTITVTSNADSGPGTLRQAIADACSGVTIDFAPALSGDTIRLNSTLTLSKDVTIDGSTLASPVTLSGDSDNSGTGDVRVFYVPSGVTATLNRLHVTRGWSSTNGGGGLLNDGTAHITNSVFSANSVDNQSGGAILNNANSTLTVTGSTFSGNTAYNGGAIANLNQLAVTNSTFSDNTSGDGGGGIYTTGSSPSVTVTIANSTFSGNSGSFGGGVWSSRTQTITNSTFSGNTATGGDGGAVWQDAETLNYANNILANSLAINDCFSVSVIGININNLVEQAGNACGGSINADPNLGPLADNGGPAQTFALLANSPAIDAGSDAVCAAAPINNLDQRGTARPNGGHCDIGAYEYVDTTAPTITEFTVPSSASSLSVPITAFTASDDAIIAGYLINESATPPTLGDSGWTASAPTSFTVASVGSHTLYPWVKDAAGHVSAVFGSPASVSVCLATVTVTSNADSGAGTLRQAIADVCGDGTIHFDSGLSGATIHLASTLTINKNLTIDGSSLASQITLSGDTDSDTNGDVRILYVTGSPIPVTVMLNSLIFTKGQAAGASDDGDGGAIFNDYGNITVTNSTFLNNSATGSGGAINNNHPMTIIDSTFSGNSSASSVGGGGAIMNSSSLTISGSTFSGNTANASSGSGGALWNASPGTTIANSTFSGNSAAVGGAIITTTGDLTVTNSTISGNAASYSNFTSGLSIQGGTTNLSNTIIANSILGNDCENYATINTNTNNLIEDGTCSPPLSGDPKLGTLANNGGPTQTFALLAGSKAIDAGDDSTCVAAPVGSLDQRGVARPNGGHCDIGAYEYVDTTAPSVTAFSATSPSNSLSIPITAFTASDDGVLAAYLITTSSTPPSASASGWTASAPTAYSVVSDGSYTLYPWAKDAAGHVSAVYGSPASVTVETAAPTASLVADNVTTSGGTTYTFTVTFSDNVAIDSSSLDDNDIRVTGPGGFDQLASLVGVAPGGNGTPRTATYQITAPGGAWDSADSGTYTIAVEANQVFDTVGNAVGAATLGSFQASLNYTVCLPLVMR